MSQVVGMTLVADVGAIRAGSEELRRLRDDAEQAARAAAGAGLRLAELGGAAEDATRDLLGLNRRTAEAARGAAELEQRFASAARAARGFQQQAEQLDRALRTGTIGQNQYYATLTRARTAYEAAAAGARQFGAANENAARQAEASQNRIVTLGGAARQAAQSVGSTIEPFTDLLGKGQQIAEAIGDIRRAAAGLPPSVVRVGVGVGTVAAGATLLFDAVESYRASVRQVTIANAAMGNTAGLSGNRLETMARSMADAAGMSRPAAREMQANLLMTGRIGGQAMERIIALSRDYGTAVGKDAVIAAAELGEALADPAQGAETLARRFNLLTDAQLQNVRALAAQGQHAKAQLVVLDAAAQRFGGLSKNVGILEGALHSVGTASSNAWDSLGSGILLTLGKGSLDDRLAQNRSRIAEIEKRAKDRATGDLSTVGDPAARGLRDAEFANRNLTPAGRLLPTEAAELANLRQKEREDLEIRRSLNWAEASHEREAPLRVAGDAARSLARTIDPLHGRQAELQAQGAILQAGIASGTLGNGDHVRQQLERVTNARTTLRTETEKAVALARAETAAATMLGLERDRYLARARTEIELSGQLLTQKERRERLDAAEAVAAAAHTQALTQLTHQLDLQVKAQERLAEAAGQGEAAMRQAAIDNEVAAAEARSAAEGSATREALMRQEAAVVKQIRSETTSDIRQAIEANEALTRAVAEGPEAVREAELAIRAHALALREATEGTDEFKAAYAHYLGLLEKADRSERQLQEARATRNQQAQQDQARRDQLMQPFKDALRGIEGAFTTAFENIFSGNRKGFADFAETIKGIFARLAAQLATMLVFQPVVGTVLQAVGFSGSTLESLGLPGAGGSPTSLLSSISGANSLFDAGSIFSLGGGSGILGTPLFSSSSAVFSGSAPLKGAALLEAHATGGAGISGAGFTLGNALGAAGVGFLAGSIPGMFGASKPLSAGIGAIGGALGAAALGLGPPGWIIGGLAGIAGGLLGGKSKREERDRKEVERQQRIAQLVPAMEQFYALAGEPMTGVSKMLADLTRQFQQLSSQAKELGLDTDLLADSFDKAQQRIKDDFAKGIEDAILAFENDAELAFQNLEEAHRQRIREAIDAEADLDRVRHLNALELKRFFEGLSAEQIESLGQAVHLADLLEAKLRELGQSAAKEIDAQIQLAASAESTARQAAEAFRNLARTLQEAVHQLRTGNLSTLSARDRLAEQRGQFDQTASAALAGDQAALQRLPQLGQQLLEASMSYNGSTTAYATDFDRVMQVLRDAGVVAGGEAGRQQTQADVLHIQAELLRKIRDELANPEGPNAEILRGQLQTLGIIDGVLKGQSTVSVEQLAQLAGVSAGERTIAEQIAAGNSKIASLLEDFLQVQQQERLERQRKEAEEAARQARQAQIDARAATARGAAANLAGQIGGVRTASATGNQELAVQMFKTMTGAVTGTASDRGGAQFDRADQLRVILSGFAQQLTAITGGTLPTDAAVFASTKYGSGYRIGSVNKAQSFGINDYVSIVSSFVRDAALQLAGITPQLRDAISQISWTNLPAAFDQLQRAVLDIRGFAAGTPSASPGWAWVGERGPELIRLRGGEEILPHDVSMRVTQAVPLPPLPRAAAANDRGVETRLEAIAAELKALRSEQERLMNAQIATAAEGARRVENAVEGNTAETRKVERAIDRQTQASLVA